MKKLRITVPDRSPYFRVEGTTGGIFVDLLWNWNEPLTFTLADLAQLLRAAKPGEIVIGRKLDPGELRDLLRQRADSDSEVMGTMIPRDELRWRRVKPRRPRRRK